MDSGSRSPPANPNAKVVVVTNLTRNVMESHLQTIFGFYGEVVKVDLPLFGKSGQNRGKASLEYVDSASAQKAVSHMDGGQLDGAIIKCELSEASIRS
ncbi:RNA-binding domain-containing protein, partial [Trametes versicolor FP-101664 SS1]|uniref:RNA-binding domain-containing protein n=1 Tax=Trametes versicolor (strain FP-101664) TaxID=717944 RepID=UPI0004621FE3